MTLPDFTLAGAASGLGVLLFAYLIRGIAGFGSALIAVPLLALSLPLAQVVPVITSLDWLAAVSQGFPQRRLIRWRDILPLAPFSVAGILSGLYLHRTLPAESLAVALGIFILAYAVYALLPLPPLRGSRGWAAPAGFCGGLVGVLFGTGGPFYVIYLTLRGLDKTEFRTTIATIFVVDGGLRLVSFTLGGFYAGQTLMLWGAALPVMAVGLLVGGRIHLSISQKGFVRLVSIILLGSGIALLVKCI